MSTVIDSLERAQLRRVPAFGAGDRLRVHFQVIEGTRRRTQVFEGIVIRRQGHGTLVVEAEVLESAAPRSVTTSTLPPGRWVRLTVRDSGVGIEPRVLERIFDPFFTTREVGVGTGLGLSLVHGIVTDLGGGIDVDSRPGEGTVFTIYLPWRGAIARPAPAEEAVPHGAGETVLLTDPVLDPPGTSYDFGLWFTPRSWFSSTRTYATPATPAAAEERVRKPPALRLRADRAR